ncbi:hypothetical protein D0862_03213 [Hortaea werneckii]|uniref:DNA-directed RNA polymerase III subunit n=1 Tax=Hortaea werneckii TaxID=91943 RepID=A0A3M7HBT5_HORWE|nr:hypothetical protein D0862_03213 [Hortaea werneckii]
MSRGGARSGGGMMRGQPLPFDVDPDLEKDILGYDVESAINGGQEDPRQALYPPYPGGVPRAPPVTAREKRLVNTYRSLTAARHAGPFYTGPKGSLKAICGTKRSAAEFNPFEDQPTYGKKYERKEFKLPDIRKHKFATPQMFPKELWTTIGYDPARDGEGGEGGGPKKKLMLSKKTGLDKLARFDEDADEKGAGGGDDDEGEEGKENEDDEEPEGPQDDDFEEDEDDDNDDYNAEQYFDGGEEDYEEAGGDEYGGDDY